MNEKISDRVLDWIALDGYAPSKEEALAMAVEIRTIRAARKGPDLWGRHPTTGLWVQIDNGSHTAAEVAHFKTIYAAAGWTKLRYSNPFATRRAQLSAVSVRGTEADVIAEILFNQRQTNHVWSEAVEADTESDAGTLASICRDDAKAVLSSISHARE